MTQISVLYNTLVNLVFNEPFTSSQVFVDREVRVLDLDQLRDLLNPGKHFIPVDNNGKQVKVWVLPPKVRCQLPNTLAWFAEPDFLTALAQTAKVQKSDIMVLALDNEQGYVTIHL